MAVSAVITVLCHIGLSIPNSNRTLQTPCSLGHPGAECAYECNDGYIAVGRHVCQTYATQGINVVNHSFYGGRCERLCAATAEPCLQGTVPVRHNTSDSLGPCLKTVCLTQYDALQTVARGAYEVFRHGRSPSSGMYSNVKFNGQNIQRVESAGSEYTGLGIIAECVADSMGWISRQEAQDRILLTLRAITNRVPGFHFRRTPLGFVPIFLNAETGKAINTDGQLMSTGLLTAGALFARTYFNQVAAGTSATRRITALVDEMYNAVRWDMVLCDENKRLSSNGTGIPMLVGYDGTCKDALNYPRPDGFYEFNEEHYTLWLAYEHTCGSQPAGNCSHPGIERMWQAWQGRRNHPDQEYEGIKLLSKWSSYIVHLPYYTVHAFNSDPIYQKLFKNHWLADRKYYAGSSQFAGGVRYGLGAGPTQTWCQGTSYWADRLYPGAGCRTWSPYAMAGYIPAEPKVIQSHLLELLAQGEAVLQVPGTYFYVLQRKSLLNVDWVEDTFTLVDFVSELFGLSTLWLGPHFFINNTNHFKRGLGFNIPQIHV